MNRAGMRGSLEVKSEVPQGENLGASSTHHAPASLHSVLVKASLLHMAHLLMTSSTNWQTSVYLLL